MDHDAAMTALRAGEIREAVITPAEDANGWVLVFSMPSGTHQLYTGHTGTEKVFRTLDHATEVAREIGLENIRVEEVF
jgi:hypothetical protein